MEKNLHAPGRDLFEYIIEKMNRRIKSSRALDRNEQLTLQEIANIVLGSGTAQNARLIGKTISQFNDYFISVTQRKVRVNWQQIEQDYPQLLQKQASNKQPTAAPSVPVEEMLRALDDEVKAVKREAEQHPIRIIKTVKLAAPDLNSFLYQAVIELPGDAELPIPEGTGILLRWRNYSPRDIAATLLSYDPATYTIIYEVERPILDGRLTSECWMLPRIEELIQAVKAKVTQLKTKPSPVTHKLLNGTGANAENYWHHEFQVQHLDASQQKAIENCLRQDITFLWGPPGTGKTHTLARLIAIAALTGKRVLAVAIANIAVDEVALKVVEALHSFGQAGTALLDNGQVLRFGYPRNPQVHNEKRLFPNKAETTLILKKLDAARKRQQKTPLSNGQERAMLQKEILELSQSLRNVSKEYIQKAKIVLTTAVQSCIESAFSDSAFDLVIVDEASMMPIPYVVSASMLSKEKMVIAGDFRQLGPIALAQSEAAQNWLHRDAFQLKGIDKNLTYSGLAMLLEQRRMHRSICDLINKPFYRGELKSIANAEKTRAVMLEPLPGTPIVLVSLLPEDGSRVETTESGSRRNRKSAEVTVQVARKQLSTDRYTRIGIITPYRGQVYLIKKLLKEINLPKHELDRITVGTVHAFQGSENDVVIWDLVETRDFRLGKLFQGETGDRLVNVAISRAQGKLIVIGDLEAFYKAPGEGLVGKVRSILYTNFSVQKGNLLSWHELR